MGRKWANIVAKKTAKDANNSRIYAKFGIEIYAAAKSGDPDPHANQKLRFVIDRAKTYNVPKHIIDRAIEKAKGAGDETYIDKQCESNSSRRTSSIWEKWREHGCFRSGFLHV